LEFRVLGFPVRIAWTFWLMAAVIGYGLARSIDDRFRLEGSPGLLPLLVIWAGCVFVSLLVHELGHAIAFRRCGIESSIVLYHFGGLAIPHATRSFGTMAKSLSPKENLVVSAAGPGAQLVLLAVVVGLAWAAGNQIVGLPGWVARPLGLTGGAPLTNVVAFTMVYSLVLVNIYWALLNLVPVYPLDGGQIAREAIVLMGGTVYQATVISLVTVALMVWWAFTSGQLMLGILFFSLGMGNWQSLQGGERWR
jgi:Zn-dependent protease